MATEVLIKSADVQKTEEPVPTSLPPLEVISAEEKKIIEDDEADSGKEIKTSSVGDVSQSATDSSGTTISVPTTNLNTNLNTITISGATVPLALANVEGQSISIAAPVVSGAQMVPTLTTAGYQLLLQQQYLNFLQLQQSMIQMSANVSD